MKHMLQGNNVALITIRRSRSAGIWKFAFVTNKIISGATSISSLDINYLFPLYLYDSDEKPKMKSGHLSSWIIFEPKERYQTGKPNISQDLFNRLQKKLKLSLTPEMIFYYVYSILYSNIYREKFAELLKNDFPRIPFTNDSDLFHGLSRLGEKLVRLHLLDSDLKLKSVSKFQGKGSCKVEKVVFDKSSNRLYINNTQYFDGINLVIWDYQIGGYKVCEKWLKERTEKILSLNDITLFCQIVASIAETIKIQSQIDNLFQKVEKKLFFD